MTVKEARKEYNKLLDRYNKATKYFERKDISNDEKEKYLGNFREVLKGLNYYLGKIGIYEKKEVLGGFHD